MAGVATPWRVAARRDYAGGVMKLFLLLLPAALLVVATACGSSTVSLDDYDQTCSVDTECISVPTGDVCSCTCGVAALNGRDAPAYVAERDSKSTTCKSTDLCDKCPALPLAACKSGKCAAVR